MAAEDEVLTFRVEGTFIEGAEIDMRETAHDADWTKINVSAAATLVIVFGVLTIAFGAIGVGILTDGESTTPRSERTSVLVFLGLSLFSLAIVVLTALRNVRRNYADLGQRQRAMRRIWVGLGGLAVGSAIVAGTHLLGLPGGVYVLPTGIFVASLVAIATTMRTPR